MAPKKTLSFLVALAIAVGPLPAAALPAASQDALRRAGALIQVGFTSEGGLEQVRPRPDGASERLPLSAEQAARVTRFLSALDPADPAPGMALALRGYLSARMPAAELEDNIFLKRDAKGVLVMTELGKTALLDILLASDGELLEPAPAPRRPTPLLEARAGEQPTGGLAAAVSRALNGPNLAVGDSAAAFDGSLHRLGAFDWSSLGPAAVPAGGLEAFDTKRLEGWSYDAEKGTVRVLVAANQNVRSDRIKSVDDESSVYAETGLDQKVFESYGAKVVRAVDNLVAVDVPLPKASYFGLALQDLGLESRPARMFKAAVGALASPVASFLGGALLPVPGAAATAAALAVVPQLVQGRALVEGEALERAGMRGKGTLVGIIDSGVDPDHPDLKDAEGNSRIASYLDFTSEGKDDVVGHGTHVAGTIGGTGAASDGALRGSAVETKFKVAKVFGTKGETDESVILAAMKWMTGGGDNGPKVDLLNMSLGGPGVANIDPLSSMANRMTVQDKILVVAAAGNEGPWASSVGSPGNARYALTVGGITKEGKVAFFSSRGPVLDEQNQELYGKPDLLGVSGDVDLSRVAPQGLMAAAGDPARAGLAALGPAASDTCIYAPGVAGPRSRHDPDTACTMAGNPSYRYMSGTSMATPQVAGMAADIIGYLKAQGYEADPFQVKALIMETSKELAAEGKDVQGAGLVNGTRLAQAVIDRVKRGMPVGNVAFELSMRLTQKDRQALTRQSRYQLTPLGLLDTSSGHLVRDERGIAAALAELRALPPTIMVSVPEVEVLKS